MKVKKNDMPIRDVLKKFVRQSKITPGYYNAKIQQIWKEKLGASVNNHTRNLSFHGGCLYITLDSAPLKNEFQMGKSKLIDLLNRELGSEIVHKIYLN